MTDLVIFHGLFLVAVQQLEGRVALALPAVAADRFDYALFLERAYAFIGTDGLIRRNSQVVGCVFDVQIPVDSPAQPAVPSADGLVAQLVERRTLNPNVAGSTPAQPTTS